MPNPYHMRHIIKFLAIILILFFYVSCSKKGPTILPGASTLIIGKWTIVTDTLTDIEDGVTVSHNARGISTDYKQFNKDSSGLEVINGNTYTFKFAVSHENDHVDLMYPTQNVAGVLQFAYTRTYAIKSIDDKSLHLFLDDFSSSSSMNGTSTSSSEFIENVFLRKE
jgi:hypothetical protein